MNNHLSLTEINWDVCIVGNGVSALWLAHLAWTQKQSVIWITSEPLYNSERAFFQRGWLWSTTADHANWLGQGLKRSLQPNASDSGDWPASEFVYFDARSTKRFRPLSDAQLKTDWGSHEQSFLQNLKDQAPQAVDLWDWHNQLYHFHDLATFHTSPSTIEVFNEPRFVRVESWPLASIAADAQRFHSVELVALKNQAPTQIKAQHFYFTDFDEHLPSLVQNPDASARLADALKGASYYSGQAGFGLEFGHQNLGSYPNQNIIIPLLVNPEKGQGAHIIGRFKTVLKNQKPQLFSYWLGLFTDEEVEDNNEVLKKIKLCKRAIDRAIAGFSESVCWESVHFQPRMLANRLTKRKKSVVLNAQVFSDGFGLSETCQDFQALFPQLKTATIITQSNVESSCP